MSNNLTLENLKGVALFVVKKNKSVLNNLHRWLIENNADEVSKKIELPILLIDDEADNASVNTASADKDPTAINKAIRKILDSFNKSSYLGITATPFANIFINQEEVKDELEDLFPRDFITVLPTPSNYIGAERIFGTGVDDVGSSNRSSGEYCGSLTPIYNQEMEKYFKFSHKKELSYLLNDLPHSLKEAIYYFILSSTIRNIRGDSKEHHSMMINVSRFTQVQNKVEELIKEFLSEVKSSIRDYAKLETDLALKNSHIHNMKDIWDQYELGKKSNCDWTRLMNNFLYDAIERIETRSVNQTTKATSLNYFNYKDIGLHVIAVGGNSLSRGVTVEGLCVSYFYRNSQMYDTLLQMGRWFGYRESYSDLFRIWLAEDAIDWYGFVSDATLELKEELKEMERENKTPEEFGLRVRQNPSSLIVTARNKMRYGTVINVPISLSGCLIETPRLKNDLSILDNNENICKRFIYDIEKIDKIPMIINSSPKAFLWKNVPANRVIQLISSFDVHPWNLNYQAKAISDFIIDSSNLSKWDVAIPFGESGNTYTFSGKDGEIIINPEIRTVIEDEKTIRVSGTHVKVGSGGSTKIGLSETQINNIKSKFKENNKNNPKNHRKTLSDRTYLIKDRNPILMIHVLEARKSVNSPSDNISSGKYLFALGLGFPSSGDVRKTATYVVNMTDLSNWMDIPDYGDDDDDF